MATKKTTDIIPEGEKYYFAKKFQKFIGEMLSITKESSPHDPDKTAYEQGEIQSLQTKVGNFFQNSKGKAVLLVCEKHHLLISEKNTGGPIALQWEDHGGVFTKVKNPPISIPVTEKNIVDWAKNHLKLSFRGEIKESTTKEPEKTY